MFTDRDMRDQVTRYLSECGGMGEYDVPAIVDDLQATYGTVDIDTIPEQAWSATLERHLCHLPGRLVATGTSEHPVLGTIVHTLMIESVADLPYALYTTVRGERSVVARTLVAGAAYLVAGDMVTWTHPGERHLGTITA